MSENREPTGSDANGGPSPEELRRMAEMAEQGPADPKVAKKIDEDPSISAAIVQDFSEEPEPEPKRAKPAAATGGEPEEPAPKAKNTNKRGDGLPLWFEEEVERRRKFEAANPDEAEEHFWEPAPGDDSLKAQIFNATRNGAKNFGFLTNDEEDQHFHSVTSYGPDNKHVAIGMKSGANVHFSKGPQGLLGNKEGLNMMSANNVSSQGDREIIARMMVEQAKREGWSKIHIKGQDKDLKNAIYLESLRQGIQPKGHAPSNWATQKAAMNIRVRGKDRDLRAGSPFRMGGPDMEKASAYVTGGKGGQDPDADAAPAAPDDGGPGPSGPNGGGKGGPGGDGGSGGGPIVKGPDKGPDAGGGAAKALPLVAAAAPELAVVDPEPAAAGSKEPKRIGVESDEGGQFGLTKMQLGKATVMAARMKYGQEELERNGGSLSDLDNSSLDQDHKNVLKHVLGKPTTETEDSFKRVMSQQLAVDGSKVDFKGLAEHMREVAFAHGINSDANAREAKAGHDVSATGLSVVNLASGAPNVAAKSSPDGLDAGNARNVMERRPDIRLIASNANVGPGSEEPRKDATSPGSVRLLTDGKPDAAAGPESEAGDAVVNRDWKERRGRRAEEQALAKFDAATGGHGGGTPDGQRDRNLPAVR